MGLNKAGSICNKNKNYYIRGGGGGGGGEVELQWVTILDLLSIDLLFIEG